MNQPLKKKPKPGNELTELPLAVVFIKAYCGWEGKVKTKTQVYTFIKKLQKAIAEKKIRKTSEYAQGKRIKIYIFFNHQIINMLQITHFETLLILLKYRK